jgi:hypothetical protein
MTDSAVFYYPIQQRWQRLRRFYESDQARDIWLPEMYVHQEVRREEWGGAMGPCCYYPRDCKEVLPMDFDGCDWRFERRGRHPHFWRYVCHAACHYLVSLNLWVAINAEPKRPWRIVTSQKHSTVTDGDGCLWDANFLALGVSADKAWELASAQPDSEELPIWEPMLHDTLLCDPLPDTSKPQSEPRQTQPIAWQPPTS